MEKRLGSQIAIPGCGRSANITNLVRSHVCEFAILLSVHTQQPVMVLHEPCSCHTFKMGREKKTCPRVFSDPFCLSEKNFGIGSGFKAELCKFGIRNTDPADSQMVWGKMLHGAYENCTRLHAHQDWKNCSRGQPYKLHTALNLKGTVGWDRFFRNPSHLRR
jgi:hypothetical protein